MPCDRPNTDPYFLVKYEEDGDTYFVMTNAKRVWIIVKRSYEDDYDDDRLEWTIDEYNEPYVFRPSEIEDIRKAIKDYCK